MTVTLADLTEPKPAISELPPLDRDGIAKRSVDRRWQTHGWVVLSGLIPDRLIDAYCDAWRETNDEHTGLSRWPECAYMHHPAILDLCLFPPLVDVLARFVGGDPALHLCLTGWRSTTRDWHQDDYLNPPYVNSWYAAAWIALDDVHPDAGPLEVASGTHRWPRLRRDRVIRTLDLDETDPGWPAKTEHQLGPLVDAELKARDMKPVTFLGRKGSVLIWHGCLYHRGTIPNNPALERRACIAHYSAKHKRPDMARWERHGPGWYFNNWQPLKTVGTFAP